MVIMDSAYAYIDGDGNITTRPTENTTHLGIPIGKVPEKGTTFPHDDYIWVEVMVEAFEDCLKVKPLYPDEILTRSHLNIGQPTKKEEDNV